MKDLIIQPNNKFDFSDLSEIWHFRELLYIFAWRDIKVRYRQTFLGILWVVLQPLASMIIFTIFFGNLAKIPSGNIPYSLFALIGLVFWTFFSTSLSHASDSMINNEQILKKIYFPKIILPISAILTSFIDFIINFIILIIFSFAVGKPPNSLIFLAFPLALGITIITTIGLGLFLSSLNVKYRDVRYILPYFIQILLFLTPIIYPLSIVSDRHKYILALNPMTSVVETMRYVFVQGAIIDMRLILISIASSLLILMIGFLYFRRTENFFADIV